MNPLTKENLRTGKLVRWAPGLGLWRSGLLLPGDRHFRRVFNEEACEVLATLHQGVYDNGDPVQLGPVSGRGEHFPLVAEVALSWGAMETDAGLVPGRRIYTELDDGLFGLVLSRFVDGKESCVVVNAGFRHVLDLGAQFFQGRDPLGPIAVVEQGIDPLLGKALYAQDVEALVWPLDLRRYKD